MLSSASVLQRIFTGLSRATEVDFSVFEAELGDVIPVVHTSIGGTRIIGRLTAGMTPRRPNIRQSKRFTSPLVNDRSRTPASSKFYSEYRQNPACRGTFIGFRQCYCM
jgi:hypothetical protein